MGLVKDIADKANIEVFVSGSSELIASRDVPELLRVMKAMKIMVVGLDGFQLKENKIIPSQNAIADFSSIIDAPNRLELATEEAKLFVSRVNDSDIFYEITWVCCNT